MSHSHSNFDCPICGVVEKEIQFYGFSHCNHPICGVCAIKLQKFSKDTGNDYDYSKCVICKQDISKIILASEIRPFEEYHEHKLLSEHKYGLLFESINAKKFYELVIRICCPQCDKSFPTVQELMAHTEQEHRKRYCELCISFNKCLISELDIFTGNDYHQHRNKKHPKCRFCDIRFYDDSHLIKHVKEQHFVCDICHRNQGYVAYSTQDELLKHYAKDHHVCEICRSINNINVFESEYALKTHKVSAHAHSLVSEGLVNITYGDRDNMRYGARRRARDMHEGDFDTGADQQELPQSLPPMSSEQEFPPLGADAATVHLQLGTPSMNTDENDSRSAFPLRDDVAACKPSPGDITTTTTTTGSSSNANVVAPQRLEKMSNNFAISVKKSTGNLNFDDFPSLSTETAPPAVWRVSEFARPQNIKQRVVQHQIQQQQQQQQQRYAMKQSDDDFPSLAGTNRTIATGNRQWGARGVDTGEETKAVETAPKVLMVSHEDWGQKQPQQSQPQKQHRQTVPSQKDFPQLASSSRPNSNTNTSTKIGAWGKYSVPDNFHDNGNGNSRINNSRDRVVIGTTGGQKGGKGPQQKKKPNKPQQQQPQPQQESQQPMRPQGPASLRGIDYIPSAAVPAQETISLVGPQQFSIIKSVANNSNNSGHDNNGFSILSDCDFPSVAVGQQTNRFSGLALDSSTDNNDQYSSHIGNLSNSKKPANPKAHAPMISSESDFPSLPGASRQKQQQHQPQQQHQSQSKKAGKREKKEADSLTGNVDSQSVTAPVTKTAGTASVVSLMDVAMRVVTQRSYTPFPDTAERNESMLLLLYERLDAGLATEFLQLSNLYRNRQLSVRDYLDALVAAAKGSGNTADDGGHTGEQVRGAANNCNENIEWIGRMLPQMCVLLPDIPLQRSLMSGMPKEWVAQLRECTRCEQVLHEADVAVHNELAH